MENMKRKNSAKANIVIVVSVTILSMLLILFSGSGMGLALGSFVRGIFGSKYAIAEVFVKAIPLTLTALGIGVGFKTGFTNLGAEGQIYMGAMAATYFALKFPNLPKAIMIPLLVIVGFVSGGLWALISGLLKAKYKVSEIIIGIMLNYIGIGLVGVALQTFLQDPNNAFPMSEILGDNATLGLLLPSTRLHAGLIIMILAVIAIYIYVWRTPQGFEMRACGESKRASQCAGISVYKNVIISALISGGLAGIAGMIEVAGLHHQLIEGISPNYGYTAIMISLLGANHPIGILLSAIGISALQVGSLSMQRSAGVPNAISTIILGITILFVIAKPYIRSRLMKKGGQNESK